MLKMKEEVSGELSLFDKIKLRFKGMYGGKLIFITGSSLLYLWHVYFHLNIPFFQATLAFMLCILFFGIVWFFGCSKNLSRQVTERYKESKKISHYDFVSILNDLIQGTITERGATEIIREMLDSSGEREKQKPEEIIRKKGWGRVGVEEIEKVMEQVLKENEAAVKDYKKGKKEALNFLVGQIMKLTGGKAMPKEIHRMIREKLEMGDTE
jgi:hypothetical protein